MPVATPLDLVVTFAPGKLSGPIYVEQIAMDGTEVAQGSGRAKIVSDNGMTETIEIVPAQIGVITVEIDVLYSDNAMAKKRVTLDVVPTAEGLKSFTLGVGSTFYLYLESAPNNRSYVHSKWLYPELTYEGLKLPIHVPGRNVLNITVEQPRETSR